MGVLLYAVLGFGTGAILALLPLGVAVIFRGAGVVNLAHGAYAMLAAYMCWGPEQHGWSKTILTSPAISTRSRP